MNMMNSPKFRRKRTSATGPRPEAKVPAPASPIEDTAREAARHRAEAAEQARTEAETRRLAEAAAESKAKEKALRTAELEEVAHAEALRRVKAARAQREADALKAREDAERQAAEDERRLEAAEAARHAEQQRLEAERHRAEEAKKREQAKRLAEERAATALREAEEKRRVMEAETARQAEARRRTAEAKAAEAAHRAEDEHKAEQRRLAAEARAAEARRMAETRRVEEEALRKAEAAKPPLPLTDMVPVTRPSAPAHAERPVEASARHTAADVKAAWAALPELSVQKAHLDRNRIITATREDPAHGAFDVLRTRLLQVLAEHGWRRVAVTSPGKDCGKTFTAANLAISLSRQENCRTLLMDLDMRRPSLHKVLGIEKPGSIGDMLRGMVPPETHLHRMGDNPINAGRNIAFALNDRPEAYASELLQDPRSEETLRLIENHYTPDVMLFDLPPALFYDDVIAARSLFDGVLLVVGGGLTTEKEITETERRLGDGVPILGMVLNKAEGTDLARYSY